MWLIILYVRISEWVRSSCVCVCARRCCCLPPLAAAALERRWPHTLWCVCLYVCVYVCVCTHECVLMLGPQWMTRRPALSQQDPSCSCLHTHTQSPSAHGYLTLLAFFIFSCLPTLSFRPASFLGGSDITPCDFLVLPFQHKRHWRVSNRVLKLDLSFNPAYLPWEEFYTRFKCIKYDFFKLNQILVSTLFPTSCILVMWKH